MTVCGPIHADELGPTYMHEHVMVDCSFSGNNPLKKLDEPEVLTWEMKDVLRAGGRTIVDCTTIGLSPDPQTVRKIAQDSGINIVASTGFYRSMVYPPLVASASADQLADIMIREQREGIGESGIRPGMLAEFASHDEKEPDTDIEKVFRAAARAQVATGLPITTHCWVGIGAHWEIEIFRQEGAALDKVVIAHVGASQPDLDHVRWILDQGVNIGIDAIGYGERDGLTFFEHDKAALVKRIVEWGHIQQITVSLDMTRQYHLKKYGGHGFAFLMDWFIPLLREVGLSDAQVDQIIVGNPRRILTPARGR